MKIFSEKVAFLAAFFTAVQPFLFFYDRLAITDSMVTSFTVWCFYFAVKLLERNIIIDAVILGFLFGGAMLTKPSANILFLILPLVFITTPIFLNKEKKNNWIFVSKKIFIPTLIVFFIGFGLYNLLRLSNAFFMIKLRTLDYIRPFDVLLHNPFQFGKQYFN